MCLDVPPKPYAVIDEAFKEVNGSRVCDAGNEDVWLVNQSTDWFGAV